MSQQEEDPSHYTRTLVVKPALSQMHDQLLPTSKSLETKRKQHANTTALIRRRPVTWVYVPVDLGISQAAEVCHSLRQGQKGRTLQRQHCVVMLNCQQHPLMRNSNLYQKRLVFNSSFEKSSIPAKKFLQLLIKCGEYARLFKVRAL